MTLLGTTAMACMFPPEGQKPVSWTFSREDWMQILADRDASRGAVAFTADPEHPTLHGLPVTVDRAMDGGYALHCEPVDA